MTPRTASIVGGIGRTLITLGALVLAFAAFQLWGTGFQEARAQQSLDQEFAAQQAEIARLVPALATTSTTGVTAPGETTTTATPTSLAPEILAQIASDLLPKEGDVLGTIKIPSIGLDKSIVEGTSRADLRKGPGHYPSTPFPGQAGNAAIAGHRTTYGAPFGDLDLVQPGDEIIVETIFGTFYYEVMPQVDADGNVSGHFIVDATALEVVADQGDNRLTLTACHPKYSARQRIVVSAMLISPPAPELPTTTTTEPPVVAGGGADTTVVTEPVVVANVLDESLGWHPEERAPTLLWGAAAALVALSAWLFGRAWKRWPAYVAASPVFAYMLWGCFVHLDRLLPAL
jgi:sortase A